MLIHVLVFYEKYIGVNIDDEFLHLDNVMTNTESNEKDIRINLVLKIKVMHFRKRLNDSGNTSCFL